MTLVIETERLRLRPLAPEDCDAHVEMMLDPRVAETLSPTGQPQPRQDLWRAFASTLGHWEIRRFGFFAVESKATGEWLGRVGPWMPEGWPALECGWTIASRHWGKGYAPEAAIAATHWIFDRFPELERVISVIAPTNVKSQAVARKIGEEKTSETFDYAGFHLEVWAADRDAWLARF